MAELISLKLTGIRSIGDDPHVIKFLKPLTIIQGLNGTGKTTTIEALNYITTGSQPAGGMKAFIHNNLIANKKRVDGSIMLQFKDAKGQEVTATKRMYATTTQRSKTGGATTRADEFTMSYKDPLGELKQISSKVMDFNKEMLNRLGVPKAILDYVLFCHQEESNWPLSEPKALKLRFDAIFEVTKYTRALQTIKKMIKDYESKIKHADTELPYMLENRSERIRTMKEAENSKKRVDELTSQMDANQARQREIKEKLRELRADIDKASDIMQKTVLLEQKHQLLQQQMQQLNVADYAGSLEELRAEIDSVVDSQEFASIEKQRAKIEADLKHAVQTERQLNAQKQSRLQQLTNLAADEKNRRRVLQEQREELDRISQSIGCMETDEDLKMRIAAVQAFVKNESARLSKEHAQIKAVEEEKIRKCTVELNKLRSQQSKMEAVIEQYEKQITRINGELTSMQAQITKLTGSPDILKPSEVEERIQQCRKDLEKSRTQLGQFDGCDFLYEKWEIDVKSRSACPLCERGCSSADADALAAKIRGRRSELPSEKSSLVAEVKRLENEVQKLSKACDLTRRLEERQEEAARCARGIEENKGQLPHVQERLQTVSDEQLGLQSAFKLTCMDYEKKKSENQRFITDLQTMARRVKEHEDPMMEDLGEVKKRFGEVEKELEDLAKRKAQLEINKNDVSSRQQKKRILDDQLRKFELKDELRRISAQVEASRWTGEPLQEMKQKYEQLNNEMMKLNSDYHKASGELSGKRKRSEDLRKMLKNKYATVESDFRKKLIEKCTWVKTVKDLKNYFRVVDESIIDFHQAKMEQINNILEDLWRRVYKGNDIQTIRIKSNAIDCSEDKRKSYDYCVVMSVDGAEIEMRDRCSAGQKVLASILIRIALADVFAGRCSILALDEPTTNLDVEKVESMGEMLNSLITCRTGEGSNSNPFQLIVITHDLRLVENLYRECRPEYVYGLSKDEFGVSRIKKHSHFEISE